jgi:hypothetical protein
MAHWAQCNRTQALGLPVHVASPQLLIEMKSRFMREVDAQDILLLKRFVAGQAGRSKSAAALRDTGA